MSHLDLNDVKRLFAQLPEKYQKAKSLYGRPLTLAEKILTAHLHEWPNDIPVRGQSNVLMLPDRVAMQDATAQMALLQFMQGQFKHVAVPTTVHCDHLIQARIGALVDMQSALDENKEVYDFLKSACRKHGIGFWEPGSGIIHQVILEKYAFPGGLMIGTDSHTPNAGGLGMIAIGVGGADAVDVMAGEPWGIRWPKLIGVKLTGSLNGWTAPKDVILKLAGILTVSGGTGAIIEYFGPGAESISCTGKATITNMGAELGATTSIFPFDERMAKYLIATQRADVAKLAQSCHRYLKADPEVEADPKNFFDRLIEIDLDTLEPYIVGPHSPDVARPISQLKDEVKAKGYPEELRYALIGSCTNSSYEDMSRAASVAQQGVEHGLKASCGFLITPGSEQIRQTIARDGQLKILENMGGTVLANACGPCIGQWKREDIKPGETNSILSSYNRNFQRRNDGNAETLAFMGSPEIVTALAFAGTLAFNPLKDKLDAPDGSKVTLLPPHGNDIPTRGFVLEDSGYVAPVSNGDHVQVVIDPRSDRLELLQPFQPWDGKDYLDLPVLLKAQGKCTTDHISPAGSWLRFRGHLNKISDNMFTGARNAFSDLPGTGIDVLTGQVNSLPNIARHYKSEGLSWIVVGDENYGEGSSREHAAMSPRFLGCRAVIVKSFARIHETNLKKQGLLALTFVDQNDYNKIQRTDRINIVGLASLAADKNIDIVLRHEDGTSESFQVKHSMTTEQISWFKAGSALNFIRQRRHTKP